jgi:hypothetical protein
MYPWNSGTGRMTMPDKSDEVTFEVDRYSGVLRLRTRCGGRNTNGISIEQGGHGINPALIRFSMSIESWKFLARFTNELVEKHESDKKEEEDVS